MKNLIFTKSKYLILLFVLILNYAINYAQTNNKDKIVTGANQTEKYLPLLKGKKVAIVANHTSVIFKNENNMHVHLVDSLLALGVNIVNVFAPEHGFRGKELGGKNILDAIDKKTGVPIKSLYGKSRKPSSESLQGIDIIIFDIQDVGVRFYTYISTMSNVMEAAAENNISVIILDRPNPNGYFVDGPMLELKHQSFVGMHPIPLVYGMTIGEYAKMINGEKWLKGNIQCDIKIIPLKNYRHNSNYSLPIKPSPNLPNDRSINLYPSLGLFEGTIINEGRGTNFQFQRYGAPFFPKTDFNYTPQSNSAYKYPKFENQLCYGVNLINNEKLNKVDLSAIVDAFNKTPKEKEFFNDSFTILAGNSKLQKQIEKGMSAHEIRVTWQEDIKKFKKIRKKYLIYK